MARVGFSQPLQLANVARVIGVTILAALMSGPATSQTGASAAMPRRTEILFLGTAGGPPLRVDRSEPSTLLIVDGRPYLIDCGIGTIRRMLEAHIPSEDVRTIFFTHLHADHDLGLADVMGNDFFRLNTAGSTQTVDIFGPPQTKDLVDAGFRYITFGFTAFAAEPGAIRAGLVDGQLRSPFVAHEIQRDGLVYKDELIRVTAAENTHYALMPTPLREQMKSYSYRIETPHGVVVFTGDTGPSESVTQLSSGADVLITEIQDLGEIDNFVKGLAGQNHWSPGRAAALMAHMRKEHIDEAAIGDMASQAHVKSVILNHYDPVNPSSYVAKVKQRFPGPVFASADLDRYCIGPIRKSSKDNSAVLTRCGSSVQSAR